MFSIRKSLVLAACCASREKITLFTLIFAGGDWSLLSGQQLYQGVDTLSQEYCLKIAFKWTL